MKSITKFTVISAVVASYDVTRLGGFRPCFLGLTQKDTTLTHVSVLYLGFIHLVRSTGSPLFSIFFTHLLKINNTIKELGGKRIVTSFKFPLDRCKYIKLLLRAGHVYIRYPTSPGPVPCQVPMART